MVHLRKITDRWYICGRLQKDSSSADDYREMVNLRKITERWYICRRLQKDGTSADDYSKLTEFSADFELVYSNSFLSVTGDIITSNVLSVAVIRKVVLP